METQSTPIRIPRESKLYIFGSALSSDYPNDLDVLVIYDPSACPPQVAYSFHREAMLDLEASFHMPVHITLLTPSEESGTEFIKRTGAIELAVAMSRLTHHSTGSAQKAAQAGEFKGWKLRVSNPWH